ncbi:MAG: penicillin-binding protein 2 [Desulfobacter sp.]|nr:penicillin-binding protein 2 [Desulfobacter sp.]WDP88020.1 MAG: penicillin-binding protein 2 [Desulfobacter sp.]
MKDSRQKLGNRILFLRFVLVSSLILLGAKSIEIQIFKSDDLTLKAEQSYSKQMTVQGDRGQILDRDLNKLGTSIDAPNITADPAQIKHPANVAGQLAKILGLKKTGLKAKLSQDRRFVILARRVSPDQAKAIKRLNLRGIYLKNDTKRFYPNRSLAAQVIGFTGKEDRGLEGLEFKFNAVLEGSRVKTIVRRDGAGRILDIDRGKRDELKGNAIVLTIDKKIQFLSEQALEHAVLTHQAKSGMALVMRPDTGELLAVAHYPEFNPNNYSDFDQDRYRNRSVTDAFEPGSIMKIFTVAAAIEKGLSPKSIFFCENGKYKIGRYTVHDTHPHEWLSLGQIIKFSSNIGAAKISETIGDKALHHYLSAFGFGKKTRVETPGESSGTLLSAKKWSKIDASAISFGQGMSVTAVQLISGIAAIANNGKLMKPMLVKKIISPRGKELEIFEPQVVRQVVSSATANRLKTMMNQVVREEGTGTRAAMTGYKVCGKTSTAQKAAKDKKGYAKNKYIAAFGGFAPQQDPKLAILVVVDEPQKEHYGGIVAAPAFKTIMSKSFSYLDIPPETTSVMVAGVNPEVSQ